MKFYKNAYCTPLEFFVEENFDIWDPKIHGPRNYLQSFYLAALIQKCGVKNSLFICRYSKWYLKKKKTSSYNERMNNGTSLSSSDYETTPKVKKHFGKKFNAKFDICMKTRCEFIIEADNKLFQNSTNKTTFVLCSFQQFLNSKLDILSLQKLEYEMNFTDYPDKYNFFELGYCGHPQYPYLNIFLDQASD